VAQGHIERRGTGWRVTIDQGLDPVTGKRRRISRTAPTKREAQAIARELGGGRAATNAFTVGQMLDAWWEHLETQDHSPATLKGYRSKLETYLRPSLGPLALRRLTTDRIDDLYRTMRTSKGQRGWALSVSTVRRTHAVLSGACEQAVKWGWLPSNPCDNASPGRAVRHEIEPPSIEEIRAVLEVATTEIDDIVRLALVTGARRGELAGLQWRDIDFKARTVTIRRSITDRKGGVEVVDERRKSKTRKVTVDPATVQMLKDRRKSETERALAVGANLVPSSYVLSEHPGQREPLRPQVITGRWRDAAERAGSKARFHDLRHFNITRLIAAGIPITQVAGRAGHESGSAMTLSVYGHWLEMMDEKAAEAIAAVIDAQ